MQITVPNHAMRALVNFLVRKGVARNTLLSEFNLHDAFLNDYEQVFDAKLYEQLMMFGCEHLNIKNIGFEHGKAFELSFWGLLGHIVAASPSLSQVLAYQRRYQGLLGNTGVAYHEIDKQQVTIRWLSSPESSANSIEQIITAWVAFAFNYTQTTDKPLSVHFVHSPLVDVTSYIEFFGCPVYFNAEFNGVRVSAQALDTPLTAFNEEVLSVLCCHAEQKLAKKRAQGSLEVIREYIITTLPAQVPTLHDIADHLGISSRQLQRKLTQQHTNLSALLTHIRRNLAVSYLQQTDHKILYIAEQLGYSEQSAFQRAFKRWYGMTPQAFRLHPKMVDFS